MRVTAAGNPSTPAATLEALARHPGGPAGLRCGEPVDAGGGVEALARDPDEYVRRGAAGNPSTPAAALEALARDPDEYVRRGAAGNPSTPAAALEALARDPDEYVRVTAAGNPSSLLEALRVSRFTKWIWGCRRVLVRPLAFVAPSGWRRTRGPVGQGRGSTTAEAHPAVKDVKKGFWEEIGKWAAAGVTGFAAVAFAWLYGHSGQGWATLKVLWMFVRSFIGL